MGRHKRKLARHDSEIATTNRGIQTIKSAYSYAAPLRDFLARFVGFTVTEESSESQDDMLGDLLEYAIVAVENLEQTETASVKLRALAPEDRRDLAQFPSMTQVIFRVIHALSSTSGKWDRSNVLATGFTSRDEEGATIGNPVVQRYASDHYRLLCGVQWQRLLERIGGHAMMFLLCHGSIYVTIDKSVDSAFHQLSGRALHDLQFFGNAKRQKRRAGDIAQQNLAPPSSPAKLLSSPRKEKAELEPAKKLPSNADDNAGDADWKRLALSKLNTISVPRHGMLYSGPGTNTESTLARTLSRRSSLSRTVNPEPTISTKQLLSLIFRKEYHIRNVFDIVSAGNPLPRTSIPTPPLDEYANDPLPRALKGTPFALIQQIQRRCKQTRFDALLRYYCPSKKVQVYSERLSFSESQVEMGEGQDMLASSTPYHSVLAFVSAALNRLLPRAALGTSMNWKVFYKNVELEVVLGRYETVTIHRLLQGIKILDIPWLGKPVGKRILSRPEYVKRQILFAQFIYWVFKDLIPDIISSFFFVTDSATSRNKLLYFRHDVWMRLCKAPLAMIKDSMFERVHPSVVKRLAEDPSRTLGFGSIRLLPKETGVRLIMRLSSKNLAHGILEKATHSKTDRSINQNMRPVLLALTFEYHMNRAALGSTLFSIGDAERRLVEFRKTQDFTSHQKYYFVKVDVQACFDSIPPAAAYRAAKHFLKLSEYRTRRYSKVTMRNGVPARQFLQTAYPGSVDDSLGDMGQEYIDKLVSLVQALSGSDEESQDGGSRSGFGELVKMRQQLKNAVFVDGVRFERHEKNALLTLLIEHIAGHIVKIGNQYYKQKRGIPQGSTVSSFLCNLLYATLEREELSFTTEANDGLLMRLTDDFLYITSDLSKAQKFFRTMHMGKSEYGVQINASKSLVNFDINLPDGSCVPKLENSDEFPFCGFTIDVRTLEVRRDLSKRVAIDVRSVITVESSRQPQKFFISRMANAVSVLFPKIYGNRALNSHDTILLNLFRTYIDLAMRYAQYARTLRRQSRRAWADRPRSRGDRRGKTVRESISTDCMRRAISKIISKSASFVESYDSRVTILEMKYLAYHAFILVLQRKHTSFKPILSWLRTEIKCVPRSLRRSMAHILQDTAVDVIIRRKY